VVDETEKGWFIKYVERDPEEIRHQESLRKRETADLDDEERIQKFVADQVEKAKDESAVTSPEFSELQRNEDEKGIVDLKNIFLTRI
jgi:DNA/RNA-binding protein KIN17